MVNTAEPRAIELDVIADTEDKLPCQFGSMQDARSAMILMAAVGTDGTTDQPAMSPPTIDRNPCQDLVATPTMVHSGKSSPYPSLKAILRDHWMGALPSTTG